MHGVQGPACHSVPHAHGAIQGRREQRPAARVEGQLRDRAAMGVVVLGRLLYARIPQLNGAVCAAGGQQAAIRVVGQRAHFSRVACESMDAFLLLQVPAVRICPASGSIQLGVAADIEIRMCSRERARQLPV